MAEPNDDGGADEPRGKEAPDMKKGDDDGEKSKESSPETKKKTEVK